MRIVSLGVLSVVVLLPLGASCTPLLGGDVACNDDGDCPPERARCRSDVCVDEPTDEGEGEGEGEGELALVVSGTRLDPSDVHPGEDGTVTFTLSGTSAQPVDGCAP